MSFYPKIALLFASFVFAALLVTAPVHAQNISESYYKDNFFRLYRFIPIENLSLYENDDEGRKVCAQQEVYDTRPQTCTGAKGDCEDGELKLTITCPGENPKTDTIYDDGSCRMNEGSTTKGKCLYRKNPTNSKNIATIDYTKGASLTSYPKLQNSVNRSYYNGDPKNILTFGANNNIYFDSQQVEYKLTALAQAAETEDTHDATGEWPLGGVAYEACINSAQTVEGGCTTYKDAWRSLESDVDGKKLKLIAKIFNDDWQNNILKARLPESGALPDKQIGLARQDLRQILEDNGKKDVKPGWWQNLRDTPTCAAGYDRDYVLVSVCTSPKCNSIGNALAEKVSGAQHRVPSTFPNPTARQNLCEAIHNTLRESITTNQAKDIIRKQSKKNPLLPFSLNSSTQAIPSAIEKHLMQGATKRDDQLTQVFSIDWLNKVLDGWRKGSEQFWYVDLGYKIQGKKVIREADAIAPTNTFFGFLSGIITAVLGESVDRSTQTLYHTVVLPPAAAQGSIIDDLENNSFNTTATREEQTKVYAETKNYTNYAEAGNKKITAGQGSSPFVAQSMFSRFIVCAAKEYSAHTATSVKEYINNVHVKCNDNAGSAGSTSATCGKPTSNQISSAINTATKKYNIPEGMLKAIYEIEALEFIVKPDPYTCLTNPASSATGLMQIIDGTYNSVTCESEKMKDDVNSCNAKKPGQLSRCDVNDAFELAARVVLQKVGGWDNVACKPITVNWTKDAIYRSAYNYYGIPADNLTNQYSYNLPNPKRTDGMMNYADIVCNKMGLCPPYPPQP